MIDIREERAGDMPAVRSLNERAFGQPIEADLIDNLRRGCPGLLSLVAEDGKRIIGHILFSPAVVENPKGPVTGMGLAPMAVLPERQRQGIGSAMVERGLDILRARGCPFVIVLGHPPYYPRFGFEPAARRGLKCQWDGIPDEAFMVMVLDPEAMAGVSGTARYRPEFDAAV
jgi:putative acetyltransferase